MDYRANQGEAQEKWVKKNRRYWGRYRETHPDYVIRNRELQKLRNKKAAPAKDSDQEIAKMDELNSTAIVKSGYYRLVPVHSGSRVKICEYLVKIDLISVSYDE